MARIVPSQVVAYIDQALPMDSWPNIGPAQTGAVAGLVRLIEEIPPELFTMESKKFSLFVLALSNAREQLEIWKHLGPKGVMPPDFIKHGNQLGVLRDGLSKCPDAMPAPSTSELSFITDLDLRLNIRIDVAAVDQAFADAEWKAATVLAGSVIEALLLWELQRRSSVDVSAALSALGPAFSSKIKVPLERWDLADYVEVAWKLNIIKENTAIQARLAREFRNLIHPGRAQRLAQKCDRSTALSAMAGMELVARDLTP